MLAVAVPFIFNGCSDTFGTYCNLPYNKTICTIESYQIVGVATDVQMSFDVVINW